MSLLKTTTALSLLLAAPLAWSAPCANTEANWNTNVKGAAPSVRLRYA